MEEKYCPFRHNSPCLQTARQVERLVIDEMTRQGVASSTIKRIFRSVQSDIDISIKEIENSCTAKNIAECIEVEKIAKRNKHLDRLLIDELIDRLAALFVVHHASVKREHYHEEGVLPRPVIRALPSVFRVVTSLDVLEDEGKKVDGLIRNYYISGKIHWEKVYKDERIKSAVKSVFDNIKEKVSHAASDEIGHIRNRLLNQKMETDNPLFINLDKYGQKERFCRIVEYFANKNGCYEPHVSATYGSLIWRAIVEYDSETSRKV